MLHLATLVLAATVGALLVHEHGHLLAARLQGLRVLGIALGGGRPWLRWQFLGVEYSLGQRFWAFGTLRYAGDPGGRRRQAWLVAAGPAANLCAALAAAPWAAGLGGALLALQPLSGPQLWVLWNLVVGAVSLLPLRRGDGHPSDGLWLWHLARGGDGPP